MGGMTFFQLMEKEWNYWGAYDGNQSIDQVAQAVADDILDGFRDTDEVDIDAIKIAISVRGEKI